MLPVTLGFGLWVALAGLAATAVVTIETNWVLTEREKEKLIEIVQHGAARFRGVRVGVNGDN
jgi:hypothetical protein